MPVSYTYAGAWGPVPILDTNGTPIDTATLSVYTDTQHTTLASLFTDYTMATAASNPVTADALGNYGFYASPGVYYGVVAFNNVTANINLNVPPYPLDPAVLNVVAATGDPAPGQVPQVDPNGNVVWANPSTSVIGGVTVNNTPTAPGQVLQSTDETDASWVTQTPNQTVGGVTVTGTPLTGQVLTATDATDANWQTPAAPNVIDGVTVTGTPSVGQVLTATSATAADWANVTATTIDGVTVTGTPTSGQVLTATSGTAADWATPAAAPLAGITVSGTPSSGQVLTATSSSTADWAGVTATTIDGVTVSGTPTSGQVLTATSGTAADWAAPPLAGITVTGTPSSGQVLTATSSSAADWANVTATTIDGVTVSGTPSAGQVLTATSSSAADWATPTAPPLAGITVTGTPASGQILTATSSTAADWAAPAAVTTIDGVTVSGTPTSGQVLTATSGSAADWQTLSASAIDGVTVTGTPAAGQVLTATDASDATWSPVTATSLSGVTVTGTPTSPWGQTVVANSANSATWALPPSAPLVYATGLHTDGTTDNASYLRTLINNVSTSSHGGTGGMIYIPPCQNPYIINSEIDIPDHVFLVGSGYNWMKRQGLALNGGGTPGNYGNPAATTFRAGSSFANSPASAIFHINNNGGLINMHIIAGSVASNSSPIGVWVSGAGNLFQNVVCDGGYIGWFQDNSGPNNSQDDEGIDNNYYNCYFTANANGGTSYYVTHTTVSTSSGNTVTVASATGIHPGMAVIDLSNPGNLAQDCIVYKVSGTTVTLSAGRSQTAGIQSTNPAITAEIQNDTLLFVSGATCLISSSDTMIHGLRNITGTAIIAGADTMMLGCHFSTGGNANVHNVIHKAGQGASYTGCTFDNGAAGNGAAGHVMKVLGGMAVSGGRIQSGVTSGNFPFIHDVCSGSANLLITGCEIPSVKNPLDALVAYSANVYDFGTSGWVAINGNTASVCNTHNYSRIMIDSGAINTTSGTPRFMVKNTDTTKGPWNGSIVSATGPYHDAAVGSTLYTT